MHDARWHSTMDYGDLRLEDKEKAHEWLAMRHRCHARAVHHMLMAQGCANQNGLQLLSDQPLDRRTMWSCENAHNSARDLLQYGDGLLGEEARKAISGQVVSYKLEMHKYEHR